MNKFTNKLSNENLKRKYLDTAAIKAIILQLFKDYVCQADRICGVYFATV